MSKEMYSADLGPALLRRGEEFMKTKTSEKCPNCGRVAMLLVCSCGAKSCSHCARTVGVHNQPDGTTRKEVS